MLVSFSCFCGFVCCKLQYINPCPLPESLSCFRHQVLQLHSRWALRPAVSSRHPTQSRAARLAPPRGLRAYLCQEKFTLWLEPSLSSWGRAGAATLASGTASRRQAGSGARWVPAPGSRAGSGSAGLGGSSAAMSPRLRSGVLSHRGCGRQSARRGERGEPGRHSRNNWRELLINLIITLSCINTLHVQKWLKSAN